MNTDAQKAPDISARIERVITAAREYQRLSDDGFTLEATTTLYEAKTALAADCDGLLKRAEDAEGDRDALEQERDRLRRESQDLYNELTAARTNLEVMAKERQGLREELARVRAEMVICDRERAHAQQVEIPAYLAERNQARTEAARYYDSMVSAAKERDALRAQLARYEQAALPESHADAAETAAEIRKSTAAGVRHEAADAILSLLDAVRVLVAEREALREGVRLHLLDDKAAKK